jgi:hypothetical protein
MEIPKEARINLSQARRFCIGLQQLAEECGMSSITYNKMGMIITYTFDDGSSVGCYRAHYDAGLVKSL